MKRLDLAHSFRGFGLWLVLCPQQNLMAESNCSPNARWEAEKGQGTGALGKMFKGILP